MEAEALNGLVKGMMMAIIIGIVGFIIGAVRKALRFHANREEPDVKHVSPQNPFMQSMTAEDWSTFELIVKTVRDSYPGEPDKGIFLRNTFKASLANRPTPQGELYPCAFGNFGRDYAELFQRFEEAVEIRLRDIQR